MHARSRFLVTLYGGLWVAGLLAGAAGADDAPATVEPGVWQKHEYSFVFMGFTSTYSCDGLADKLKRLLLVSGARADAKSEPGACASPYGRPEKLARAELTFYTLVPAGTVAATGEPVRGSWRSVTLGPHAPRGLAVEDCELFEQFRDTVLKKMFTTRNLVNDTTCVPHQESGSQIDLRFETFAPVAGAAPAAAAYRARVYVYPKQGQSKEQQAKDRAECESTAIAQSGFDPAQPPPPDAAARRSDYTNALAACLEPRGYTVR